MFDLSNQRNPPDNLTRVWGVLYLLVLASSLSFALLVPVPVFDDVANMRDVSRYAKYGVSVESIRAQVNPPGPMSFIWAATLGDHLGAELRGYRLAIWVSWLLIGFIWLVWSSTIQKNVTPWVPLAMLLSSLHAPIAAATVLTEGPALLFAIGAVFIYAASLERLKNYARGTLLLSAIAGTLVGLAAISRQYYLCLLPAFATSLFTIYRRERLSAVSVVHNAIGLLLAAIPIGALYLIWGGLAAPAIRYLGEAYPNYSSDVGMNPVRPLIAALCIGIYSLPFTWAVLVPYWRARGLQIVIGAVLISCVLIILGFRPFGIPGESNTGPILSVLSITFRIVSTEAGWIAYMLALAAALVGIVCLVALVQVHRQKVFKIPVLAISASVIFFFAAVQIGVGGNIPFYDRYYLQVAFFIGVVVGGTLGRFGLLQWAVSALALGVGQAMLWRYASIG